MKSQMKTGLIIGFVLIILLAGALSFWALAYRNNYVPLYQGLDEQQMAQAVEVLKVNKADYQIGQNGQTLLVPESQLQDVRVQMTQAGALSAPAVGLEIFDEVDYGLTEFAQKVNFQRAMQGELARTIMQFPEVKLARVHLTLPKKSLFQEQQNAPKASVTVITQDNSLLTPSQVKGIQQLVSSAVEALQPEQVTVVNDKGEVLSSAYEGDLGSISASADKRLQDKIKYEAYLKEKALILLTQYFPVHQLSISIDTQINYDRVKQAVTNFVPNGQNGEGVVVKKQNSSITTYPADTSSKSVKADTNHSYQVEYQNGSKVEQIEFASGAIEKVTVGIVLPMNLSVEQAQQWSDVISAGLGLDATRGDRVQIMGFEKKAVTEVASVNVAPQALPTPENRTSIPEMTQIIEPAVTSAPSVHSTPDYLAQAEDFVSAHKNLMIGITALFVLLLTVWSLRSRQTKQPEALSQAEREALLIQIRQWLQTEQKA